MMKLEGRTLDGRYQLRSLLGAGGMARVYLATDRVLERQAAVKVLSPPYAQDPSFLERFQREARAAASLSHPSIVAVFDSGTDGDLQYLVMEYVPGESLAQLLARQGGLAPRPAVELAIQACAALAAAHAKGLVHRDIKPANVLVSDDGQVSSRFPPADRHRLPEVVADYERLSAVHGAGRAGQRQASGSQYPGVSIGCITR